MTVDQKIYFSVLTALLFIYTLQVKRSARRTIQTIYQNRSEYKSKQSMKAQGAWKITLEYEFKYELK